MALATLAAMSAIAGTPDASLPAGTVKKQKHVFAKDNGRGPGKMQVRAVNRNKECYCGSKKKFKKCCMNITPPWVETKLATSPDEGE